MNKSKVALVACNTYDDGPVYQAVKKGIALLGGAEAFARPGERIVLKPNVLFGMDPMKCVTTHPEFLRRWQRRCRKQGLIFTMATPPASESARRICKRPI